MYPLGLMWFVNIEGLVPLDAKNGLERGHDSYQVINIPSKDQAVQ